MKKTASLLGLLVSTTVSLSFSAAVHATFVGPVSSDPTGPVSISDKASSQVAITWEGQSDSRGMTTPNSNYLVSSDRGEFRDGAGSLIATVPKRLSETLFGTGTNISDFDFRETLRVPAAVIDYMQRNGLSQINYQRVFSDFSTTTTPDTDTATLALRLSNQGAFSVIGLDLRFDNRELGDVLTQDDVRHAEARIQHSGTGRLKAIWEISTPASAGGMRLFRRLDSKTVILSGRGPYELRSPALPSEITGPYQVRLNLEQNGQTVQSDTLFYSVIRGQKTLRTIDSYLPLEGASVSEESKFTWQHIPGSTVYKLEFSRSQSDTSASYLSELDDADRYEFVSGLLVPASALQSTLTELVMQRLKAGEQYQWRVVAIDQQGQATAASPWKAMSFTR